MTYPRVPVFAKTADWPRKVADVVNSLLGRVGTLESQAAASAVITEQFASLGDFADDTAAASGGVAVGELYRTGSAVKIRVA